MDVIKKHSLNFSKMFFILVDYCCTCPFIIKLSKQSNFLKMLKEASEMKKNLLTRVAATAVMGLMLFNFSVPVLAEEMNGNIETTDTGTLTDITKAFGGGGKIDYFKGDDGVIYYDLGVQGNPMPKPDALFQSSFADFGVKFHGWDNDKTNADTRMTIHWAELGRILQLNMGLVNMDQGDIKANGFAPRNGRYAEMNSLRDAENYAMESYGTYSKRAFQDETKGQPVVAFFMNYAAKNATTTDENPGVGVYLYNFKVSPLMTNDYLAMAAEKGNATETEKIDHSSTAKLGVFNDTPLSKTDQQEISIGIDESSTKEKNGNDTYSFTESAKISAEMLFGPVKGSAEVGFSAEQAFSTGWSESKSVTNKSDIKNNQSITLLPYSGVNLLNSIQSGNYKQIIDFPVAISYDVKIVNYGQPKNPKADIIATYEKNQGRGSTDAQSDLYQRYFNHKESQNLKYDGDLYPYSVEDALSSCAKTAPYFTASKTVFDGKINNGKSIASGLIAMHPLKSVDTTKECRTLKVKPGDGIECRDIPIKGYLDPQYTDGKGGTAEYSTFNFNRGHWEIESGDDVIRLVTDGQKHQRVEGIKEGKASLIYKIDETVYNSNDNRKSYTKNSDLNSTAVITITVSNNASENTGLINHALKQLETLGQGWTVDNGFIFGDPTGDPLESIQIPTGNLDNLFIEASGQQNSEGFLGAVQMKLTGPDAEKYDLYYRSYLKDLGWMNWAEDTQLSGTTGFEKSITAVQVMILEKGNRPVSDNAAFTPAYHMENTNGLEGNPLLQAILETNQAMENISDFEENLIFQTILDTHQTISQEAIDNLDVIE